VFVDADAADLMDGRWWFLTQRLEISPQESAQPCSLTQEQCAQNRQGGQVEDLAFAPTMSLIALCNLHRVGGRSQPAVVTVWSFGLEVAGWILQWPSLLNCTDDGWIPVDRNKERTRAF
jgi:hypothetical protein